MSDETKYNWKISLVDILYQVKLVGGNVTNKEDIEKAMVVGGFDISKPYKVTDKFLHRPLHSNTPVDMPFIEGYADDEYLCYHGISTVEYLILSAKDKELAKDLTNQCQSGRD